MGPALWCDTIGGNMGMVVAAVWCYLDDVMVLLASRVAPTEHNYPGRDGPDPSGLSWGWMLLGCSASYVRHEERQPLAPSNGLSQLSQLSRRLAWRAYGIGSSLLAAKHRGKSAPSCWRNTAQAHDSASISSRGSSPTRWE